MPFPEALSPEAKFILESARVIREKKEKALGSPAGRATPDWSVVFALADENRVLPLVCRYVTTCCEDIIPADLLARMKDRCFHIGTANLRFVSLLHELLALFEERGVSVLAIKGPVFTASVYGDIGLRSYGDLDFLVKKSHLRSAIELLQEIGFRKDIELDRAQYEKLVFSGHHASLLREGSVVELLWELSGRYCSSFVEYDDVADHAASVRIGKRIVPTLGTDDLLLYLCIHGSRHYWLQLDAVCCVHELLVESCQIDWEAVWQQAEEWGAVRMLLLGLHLVQRLFGADVPEWISRRFAEYPNLDRAADWCIGNMFSEDSRRRGDPGYFDYVRYHYALMDRKGDWLRLCVKPLFQPTHSDWQWLRLPVRWSFLYYVLRPVRLAEKYCTRFFHRS